MQISGQEPEKPDDKIVGNWKLREPEPKDRKLTGTLEITKDGKYTFKQETYEETGTVRCDLGKAPKQINLIPDKPDGAKPRLCIYALTDDGLKLCTGKNGGERPARFETNLSKGWIMWQASK
jgi:uncharacterized protein (TIGR03067 family)